MSGDMICAHRNIRVTKSGPYREYLANTRLWQKIGNDEFAKRIRDNALSNDNMLSVVNSLNQEYVLYHSWLPGVIGTSAAGAALASQLIRGLPKHQVTDAHVSVINAIEKMGWCTDGQVDLDNLVDKTQTGIIAIQNRYEQKEYLQIVKERRPKIVLEIGTARGGMLYCFSQLADPCAEIISIDLPGAPNCGGQTDEEREFFATFGPDSQRFHFIPENSRLHSTKEKVAKILNGRKVDLLFIDGDHSYAGVRSDFEMYREFMAPDGLLTLHDICMLPENWGTGNEVGLFWRELTRQYETREIIDSHGVCSPRNPFGKAFAWGIGLIGGAIAK